MILAAAAVSFLVVTLDDVNQSLFDVAMTQTATHAGATIYSRAVVGVPLCGPSRATFLTGQEAETTGILGNAHGGNWGNGFMPKALRGAGYRTAIIGKMPNGYAGTPSHLGFKNWAVLANVHEDRYFDAPLDVDGNQITAEGYVPDELYARARDCVRGSKPYFCWVASIGAHAPADAAPRHENGCANVSFSPGPAFNEADMSDKPSWMRDLPEVKNAANNFREQCATLLADDDGISRLLSIVSSDPTVCVIVTADNGRLHGQHRLTGKSVLYDESIIVPLMTWNCGTAPGHDDRLVSNVDIPAHILSLAGVAPLRELDGRPLDGNERGRVRIVGGTDVPAAGFRRRNRAEWQFDNGETEEYNLRTGADPWQLDNMGTVLRR